ncbi:AbrB/MazE/SpoVT family DNA-binding domain-containing protein [Sphingomonas sp. PAMC 26605]|uniref:AbrB/MazE/SpoVT family DNA-binding domain-containing protein n=1 Tax=Sphingomonas sp. PAMC 26605 TaxID=1112214 RepID=UPI00026CCFF0|nr:AbrB/MazE/SpoVT family DNA-binding domain-containing protein [Sphingomonas sp. PAMC 26605]
MGVDLKLSSKGQVVIPKDVRDALGLDVGSTLRMTRVGRQIVLEAPLAETARPKINFEEFRKRVPRYEGPSATLEQMNEAVDRMFAERGRP